MMEELSDADLERYARHVILDEIGEEGQVVLLRSKVCIVGAGGLGSPVLMYLAAAGIGRIGLVDFDTVDRTNLQRQIAHTEDSVGISKVASAATRARALNPTITIDAIERKLDAETVQSVIEPYDLVIDGTDNYAIRILLNDACFFAKKPLVSASVVRFEGQMSTFRAYEGGACYRCVFPEAPAEGVVARCDTAGILGPVAGVMGTLQATEVIKQILGLGTGMVGRLMLYDALDNDMRMIKTPKNPACPLCGDKPVIRRPGG
jgi:molybdopterin/thiamine biosynthesis adenylyltransferase